MCRTEASTVAEIKSALLEFSVIFFRHQPINQDHQLRLAAQFGTIEDNDGARALKGLQVGPV